MLIRVDTLQPWAGEALHGISYPVSIEQLWTAAELAAIGLVVVKPFIVPDGFMISGPATYAADGTQTYPVSVIPPPTAAQITATDTNYADLITNDPRLCAGMLFLVNGVLATQGKPALTASQLHDWLMNLVPAS
jgi:hypothetical protein